MKGEVWELARRMWEMFRAVYGCLGCRQEDPNPNPLLPKHSGWERSAGLEATTCSGVQATPEHKALMSGPVGGNMPFT